MMKKVRSRLRGIVLPEGEENAAGLADKIGGEALKEGYVDGTWP